MQFDEYPIGTSLGQTRHQTSVTNKGNLMDHDKPELPAVVDENGVAVISEDEKKIEQLVKEAISIDNLVATFNENSHETLLKLLALQDNKHPLKKGGVGISYRTDALIMHCKMEFTNDENVVFDAILGMMSSLPENHTYRIEPRAFLKYAKNNDPKYIYKVFKNGANKLKERHLVFTDLGPDGDDEIEIPWFNILRHHKGNRGEQAFIEFAPTDFFKDLALCSRLVHGAYGALEVIMQLQGKYTIALYWYLENKKRYKEYPAAKPGYFEISVEELKHQFSIPESYPKAEIERRVLAPAMKSINSIKECDFTFKYSTVTEKGKLLGYSFQITEKKALEDKTKESKLEEDDSLKQQIKIFFKASSIKFTEDEIDRIYQQALRQNKDTIYMMQILLSFKQRMDDTSLEPIEDKVGYICKMIESGSKQAAPSKRRTNNFINFDQNDYDFEDLESKLVDN